MTTRRSQDLTNDLVQDLTAEGTTYPVARPSAGSGAPPEPGNAASPFIETAFYPAPRGWRRPRVARRGSTLSLSAGPLRVRIGRG